METTLSLTGLKKRFLWLTWTWTISLASHLRLNIGAEQQDNAERENLPDDIVIRAADVWQHPLYGMVSEQRVLNILDLR